MGKTGSKATHSRSPAPTTADLRRDNLARLLRLVHEHGPISRAALTEQLCVARPTVGVLLDALAAAGLITEQPPEPNRGRGRPSPVIDVVPEAATTTSVDLGVDTVRVATVGLGGHILHRQEWRPEARRSPDETIAYLGPKLRDMLVSRRRAGTLYQAVAVACWGVVRSSDGFVHTAPNLGWRDVALGDGLRRCLAPRRATARPLAQRVVVANDSDLGAMVEYRRGAGASPHRLLYVHSNIGVGGGIVIDGHLLGAAGTYTGEIGHMRVNPNGIRCRCGTIGCWETEVDERALLRHARVTAPDDGAALVAAVRKTLDHGHAGDRSAVAAVNQVATALGDGLADLVHILGPDRIVLGGYLADLLELCPALIRHALDARGFSPEARHVPIVAAQHREDAELLGAAEYGFEPLLDDPQEALM